MHVLNDLAFYLFDVASRASKCKSHKKYLMSLDNESGRCKSGVVFTLSILMTFVTTAFFITSITKIFDIEISTKIIAILRLYFEPKTQNVELAMKIVFFLIQFLE